MSGNHQRLLIIIGAAAAAGTLALTGAAAANAASPSPARPGATGTEHFQLVTASATSNTLSAIATGVFTAGGVDHPGSSADTLTFPGGTFKVAPSAGTGTQTLNPKTCLLSISLKGTYKIFDGTGTYTGISGHGTCQLSTLGIAARSAGKCTQNSPPVTYQQIIQGSGPVHL